MHIEKLFMLLSTDGDMVWRQALQWMKWIIYSQQFSLMCLDKNMEVKRFRGLNTDEKTTLHRVQRCDYAFGRHSSSPVDLAGYWIIWLTAVAHKDIWTSDFFSNTENKRFQSDKELWFFKIFYNHLWHWHSQRWASVHRKESYFRLIIVQERIMSICIAWVDFSQTSSDIIKRWLTFVHLRKLKDAIFCFNKGTILMSKLLCIPPCSLSNIVFVCSPICLIFLNKTAQFNLWCKICSEHFCQNILFCSYSDIPGHGSSNLVLNPAGFRCVLGPTKWIKWLNYLLTVQSSSPEPC